MFTVTESTITSVVLPRVRMNARAYQLVDLKDADKHNVRVSYSEAVVVSADRVQHVASSKSVGNDTYSRHAPRLYAGDLNLHREYVDMRNVRVEGSRTAVQSMLNILADADESVEAKHPESDLSILFWGLNKKVLSEFFDKFSDVLVDCMYGFSFHGLFRREFVHGKSALAGDPERIKAFGRRVEALGGSYIVKQYTFKKVAV